MRLVRIGLTLSALALGVVSALLSGCGHSQAATGPATPPPPQVTVAQVIARPLHQWVELTGTLQAINSVQVRPRVSGYVDAVRFTEGARVAKGAILFQIDPRPFQLEVDRLGAELNRAQSRLEVATAGRARAERLIAQNAISREEYEQLTSAATEAAGDVGSIHAQLDAARLNLEFTHVRSPIDGHVSRALITAGNLVSSSDVLTTVVSDDPIYAYFDTDEATYLQFARLAGASAHARGDYASAVYMGLVGEQGYPPPALDLVALPRRCRSANTRSGAADRGGEAANYEYPGADPAGRQSHRRDRGLAAGAGDQRRRGHAVPVSQATSDGVMTLTITFARHRRRQGPGAGAEPRGPGAAALPQEVQRLGVTTNKASPDLTMVGASDLARRTATT
jgi:biotin carboxyl carrier protein